MVWSAWGAPLESTFGFSISWSEGSFPRGFSLHHMSQWSGGHPQAKNHIPMHTNVARCNMGIHWKCAFGPAQIAYTQQVLLTPLGHWPISHLTCRMHIQSTVLMHWKGITKWCREGGNEETEDVPSLHPPFPPESTEMGRRESSPHAFFCCRSWTPIYHMLGGCSDHQKLEDTLRWSSIDVYYFEPMNISLLEREKI